MKRSLWKSIVLWFAAFVLAACGGPPTDGASTGSPATGENPAVGTQAMTCEEAFAAAVDAANIQETPEALDATFQACDTIDAWTQAAQANASALGQNFDAEAFLIERCSALGPEVSSLCAEVREQFPERFQ